jgi:phage shock protein PspC (stress-responsive transcriptional regulator)
MKKNISINISGIIFHIEEDGYEVLKKYLDSINKYFSSFEDSSEILSDIESRIAEIFLSKLNEGKQIITFEDVNSLVATMGSVSDFKAAEEQEFAEAENSSQQSGQQAEQKTYQPPIDKKLHRDQARKIVGGVCAGLANYFNIDAVWVRLFFAILTFAWGFGVLVYVIMWIAIPGSYVLEEPSGNRKLFRDNERKVIGGVAGGLAAYFGFHIIVIRILFVILAIFGGFGLVAYIVLWIVLPAAITITEKVEMQGEPVTLSNIESSLKKNLKVKEDEENVFVKILLFPFRLIGMILTALGKLIYPLIEVIRVAIGVFITMIGLSMVLTLIVFTGILFGLISGASVPIHIGVPFNEASLPIEALSRTVPSLTIAAAFIASLIPGIFIMLLGISAIAKRLVFSTVVGWSMFALFIVSLLVLSFTVPKIVYSFKEDGEFKTEAVYTTANNRIVLKLNEVGLDEYIAARVNIKGYDGTGIKVVTSIESQGISKQIAIENAKMVEYGVTVHDSIFTFDSNVIFKKDAVFRAQHAVVTLYVPYDFPFYVDEDFRLLRYYWNYPEGNQFYGNTWVISKETNDFKCVSCPVVVKTEEEIEAERISTLEGYSEIEISGAFDVTIQQERGTHAIEIDGTENEEKNYSITQVGKTLKVEYKNSNKVDWKNLPLNLKETKITITLPELKGLKLKGAGTVDLENFDVEDLDLEIFGAIKMKGKLTASRVNVNITGASQLELIGNSESLNALVEGASGLKAFDFSVQKASIETVGFSSAKVTVHNRLEIKEGVGSKISYRGSPGEIIKE